MKKIKIIAVFLSFIMAVMFIPTSMLKAFADGIKKIDLSEILADTEQPIIQIQDENIYEKIENNEIFIEKECVEKRTENSKYFLLDNGMIMRQKYAAPIHYETQDGFKEINNGLILKTDETGEKYYQNAANSFSVRLTESLTANKNISIKRGEYSLSFALNNCTGETMREAKASVKQTENMYAQSTAKLGNISDAYNYSNKQMSEAVQPEIGESKLTYKGVFNDVDFEYSVNSFGIKEDIIVNKLKNNYEFSYTITAPDLNLVMQQDGSIIAYDQMQEAQFEIPAPTMTDGANAFSNEVSYALMQNESGTYTLKIIADKNWINAAERVMPVKIDPAVNVTRQTAKGHTHYLSGSMSDEIDQNKIKFGKYNSTNCEAYMIFPNENRQTYFYGYQLVYGKLKYYVSRKGSGSIGYNIHAVYSEDPISIDNCVNLQTTNLIASETISNSTAAEKNVYFIPESFNDCPDIFFKWSKTSNTENYGEIDVKSGNLPSITEYYISTVGIKEDMPYEEFEYNGGSANVNLLNGALTASFNLLNISTLKNPMSLQLYYNDGYSDIMSEFGMSEIFGKNMKLNFQQAIDRTNDTVRYVDEDGSIETLRKGNGIYYSVEKDISYNADTTQLNVNSYSYLYFGANVDLLDSAYVNRTTGAGNRLYQIVISQDKKITAINFFNEGLMTHYIEFTYSGNKVNYATSYIANDFGGSPFVRAKKCKFTYDSEGYLKQIENVGNDNAGNNNNLFVLKYNNGKLYEVYDFDGNGYRFTRVQGNTVTPMEMASVTNLSAKDKECENYYEGDYVSFTANNTLHSDATVTQVRYFNSNFNLIGSRYVSRHFYKGMGSEWYESQNSETVIITTATFFSEQSNYYTYKKIKYITEQKPNNAPNQDEDQETNVAFNSSVIAPNGMITGTVLQNHGVLNKTGTKYALSFMLETSNSAFAYVFVLGRKVASIKISGATKGYYVIPTDYISTDATFSIMNVGENYIIASSASFNYYTSTQYEKEIYKSDSEKNYVSTVTTDGYDSHQFLTYDYRGQVTSAYEIDYNKSVDERSKTYTYTYQSYPNAPDIYPKRLISVTDGTKKAEYTYKSQGNQETVTTKVSYNNKIVSEKISTTTSYSIRKFDVLQQENGATSTVKYELAGGDIRATQTISNGMTTSYSYNDDGQIDSITRDGIIHNFTYENGRVTGYAIGDAQNIANLQTYSLIRSNTDIGSVTAINYNGTNHVLLGYNQYGDIKTVVYANGASRTYNYNYRKLLSVELKDTPSSTPTTISYGYKGADIKSVTQSVGGVTQLTYTFSDTKTKSSTTVSGDISASYEYNYSEIDGLLTSRKTTLNNTTARTETFNYNSDGALQSHGDIEHKTTYTYDEYGRSLTKSQYNGTTEKQKYVYTYAEQTELNEQNEPLLDYKSNRITKVENDYKNVTQSYKYNSDGYLIQNDFILENVSLYQDNYTYDSFGRLIKDKLNTYTYDKYNNMLARKSIWGTESFSYDDPNNKTKLTSMTADGTTTYFNYDTAGNMTTYKGNSTSAAQNLFWTRGNMLASGRIKGNQEFSYEYGPDNLRYKKTVNGEETYYYWDGNLLVGEKTGTDFYRYFYDASGIIGMKYNSNYYYFEKNILGDIIAIYKATGERVCVYTYDGYGRYAMNASNIMKFGYRGYYYDAETGFYYLQNRYYDPVTARFISPDQSSLLPTLANSIGELNLYVYCNNNPIMYTDPTGEFAFLGVFISIIIGGLISGGFAIAGQISEHGFNIQAWDWDKIGISVLAGAVASGISAISIGGVVGALFFGGIGSLTGGVISGSVYNLETALVAISLGAFANLVGYGINNLIAKSQAKTIYSLGNKAKSLAIQKLQAHSLNMGSIALKASYRNAFKNMSQIEIQALLMNANSFLRNGIYSTIVSGLLSGWI